MARMIIGIHGLKNKPPEAVLKRWWKRSLSEGLRENGHPFQLFSFELVYWAKILHSEPLSQKIKDEKHPLYMEFPYVPSAHQAKKPPSPLRKKVLDYIDDRLDAIFMNEDMSINLSSVNDFIIRRYFRDLNIYYSQYDSENPWHQRSPAGRIRSQLIQRLEAHKDDDVLLIAHSMGSIIAYDVLVDDTNNVQVDTFVTVGSPLGLPIVRGKILSEQKKRTGRAGPIATPLGVKRHWYNFSDLRDKIAIDYRLSDDFDENIHHVRVIDETVINDYEYRGKANPHSSYGYLRTSELAHVVYEFLIREKPKFLIELSEKIQKVIRYIPMMRK